MNFLICFFEELHYFCLELQLQKGYLKMHVLLGVSRNVQSFIKQ